MHCIHGVWNRGYIGALLFIIKISMGFYLVWEMNNSYLMVFWWGLEKKDFSSDVGKLAGVKWAGKCNIESIGENWERGDIDQQNGVIASCNLVQFIELDLAVLLALPSNFQRMEMLSGRHNIAADCKTFPQLFALNIWLFCRYNF